MRASAKAFLLLYGMMIVGIAVLVALDKHGTNEHLTKIDRQVRVIREQVGFPCTAGRDKKCAQFLRAIVRYSSYRQQRAIAGNGLKTPRYLRAYVRQIISRDRMHNAQLKARVKAKILKRRKAHAAHGAVSVRGPAKGSRPPGPSGGQGHGRNK